MVGSHGFISSAFFVAKKRKKEKSHISSQELKKNVLSKHHLRKLVEEPATPQRHVEVLFSVKCICKEQAKRIPTVQHESEGKQLCTLCNCVLDHRWMSTVGLPIAGHLQYREIICDVGGVGSHV